MKVLISQPMNGRKTEDVLKQRRQIIERFEKIHIDVVESYFDEEVEGYQTPALFYLAKTIDMIGKDVDAVYFAEGWQQARGCCIERKICEMYDILILDESFFQVNRPNGIQIKRI